MRAWTPGRRATADHWRSRAEEPCQPFADPTSEAARAQALLRTVEAEIIPRLMLLHREQRQDAEHALQAAATAAPLDDADVERLAAALLAGSEQAWSCLQAVQQRGVTPVHLCLDLLSPAARRLGEWWSDDRCDFTQVTIGLGRLQALLHRVTAGLQTVPASVARPLSAVFAPAPGEQHTLGLSMVRDFFRAAGWQVHGEPIDQPSALLALLRRTRFDLVGFTLGAERHVDALATLIGDARAASLNSDLRVMVGGPLLLAQPDLFERLGADATATDASRAILAAHDLVVKEG